MALTLTSWIIFQYLTLMNLYFLTCEMMTAVLPESPGTLLAKSVSVVSNTPAEASLRKVFSSYPQGCVCPGPNLAQSWLSFAHWREGVFAYVCVHLVDPKSIFFNGIMDIKGEE